MSLRSLVPQHLGRCQAGDAPDRPCGILGALSVGGLDGLPQKKEHQQTSSNVLRGFIEEENTVLLLGSASNPEDTRGNPLPAATTG
jgi:hypothetical protein